MFLFLTFLGLGVNDLLIASTLLSILDVVFDVNDPKFLDSD